MSIFPLVGATNCGAPSSGRAVCGVGFGISSCAAALAVSGALDGVFFSETLLDNFGYQSFHRPAEAGDLFNDARA